MPTYSVLVPFTDSMFVEVEADSLADAKEAAFEAKFNINNVQELEYHEHVVEGNVFCGVLNSMVVELIDDASHKDQ